MVGNLTDIITCAKFKDDIFRGYNFTRGSNFPFYFLFLPGPYNSAALLCYLWLLLLKVGFSRFGRVSEISAFWESSCNMGDSTSKYGQILHFLVTWMKPFVK